jgi:hypothetical protein
MKKRAVLIVFWCILFVHPITSPAQDLDLHLFPSSTYADFSRLTGQLVGSGFYHTAGIHSFPGVDFGVKAMFGFIPKENRTGPLKGANIMRIPMLQADVGLIHGFEIGGRLFKFKFGEKNAEDVMIASGLLKYNILKGLVFPDITVYSAYSRLTGINDFSLNICTIGGMIGKSLPLISVYAGGNYNFSRLDVRLVPKSGLYPAGYKKVISQNVAHYTTGVSLGLTPFTKVNAEFNMGTMKTITVGIILSIF